MSEEERPTSRPADYDALLAENTTLWAALRQIRRTVSSCRGDQSYRDACRAVLRMTGEALRG
jgi:hypothetical protein